MKLTTAQSAELHIAVCGVLTLLAGVATTVYQSGNPSLGVALGTLTAALGVSFVSIMHAMMSSPQAPQALKDTEQQVIQELPQLATWIDSRLNDSEKRLVAWFHQSMLSLVPIPPTSTPAPDSETTQSIPVIKPSV